MDGHDRRISFEGITNARDLGGLTGAGGKTVRRGKLLRSANLSKATDSDVEKLREVYDLRLVLDLRTGMAAAQKPDVAIEGVHHEVVSIFDDAMIGVTHESDRDYERRKKLMPPMTFLYQMMVTEPSCRAKFHTVLTRIMLQEEGSVLWHCSEGKDRCGLVTLFLLSELQVDREQILEDYLLTNETAFARADYYYRKVLENGGDEAVAVSVRDAFVVKPEYLQSALDVITAEFGDVEHYLTQGLGLSRDLLGRFRERMLE